MKTQGVIVVISLVAIFAITWSLKYFGRYQPFADLMSANSGSDSPRVLLQITDATIEGSTAGRRTWRVSARQIDVSQDRRLTTVSGIQNGQFFNSNKVPVVSVSANVATYQSDAAASPESLNGLVSVSGSVVAQVLKSPAPTLSCEFLTWSPQTDTIDCPGIVRVQYPDGAAALEAHGCNVDLKQNVLTAHEIIGRFKVRDGLL